MRCLFAAPLHRRRRPAAEASRLLPVREDSKHNAARRAARAAQKQYERDAAAAQRARREAFIAAQKAGLSLRAIGEEVGLHHTRVGQIIRGE